MKRLEKKTLRRSPRRRRRQRGRDAAVGGASAAASSCTALSALLRSMHSHRHDCDPCRRSAIDRDREEPGSKRLGRSRLPRSGRKTHTREFQKRRGGRKKNSCFFKFTHPAPTARARRPRVAPAGRQREHPALSRGGDEGSRDDEERRVRGGAAIEWSRQKEELIESKCERGRDGEQDERGRGKKSRLSFRSRESGGARERERGAGREKKNKHGKTAVFFCAASLISCFLSHSSMSVVEGSAPSSEVRLRWRRRRRRKKEVMRRALLLIVIDLVSAIDLAFCF